MNDNLKRMGNGCTIFSQLNKSDVLFGPSGHLVKNPVQKLMAEAEKVTDGDEKGVEAEDDDDDDESSYVKPDERLLKKRRTQTERSVAQQPGEIDMTAIPELAELWADGDGSGSGYSNEGSSTRASSIDVDSIDAMMAPTAARKEINRRRLVD